MNLRKGMRVREKYSNAVGMILEVFEDHLLVEWDSGMQDIVSRSYYKFLREVKDEE